MRYLLPNGSYVGSYQPFIYNDIQYPSNWFELVTQADIEALGAVPVVEANTRADDRYYNVVETVSGAVITYINTPKELQGLKNIEISKINATAYSILLPTDFMDFRPNYTPPAGWLEWRESVRVACQDAKVAINACTTVEELIALPSVDWPKDPNWVAPPISEGTEV